MTVPLLTFELTKQHDQIEVHADSEGLAILIKILERVLKTGQHEHLSTPGWGGSELSEDKQGLNNNLIEHVKVILWKEAGP